MFESGYEIDEQKYFKGLDPPKTVFERDTVGDPFKDTIGPCLNILIKLMAVISLVIAQLIKQICRPKDYFLTTLLPAILLQEAISPQGGSFINE